MKRFSLFLGIIATTLVGCNKWTETERVTFENQNVKKLVTLIEAQKESDLNPEYQEYYRKIREEYRNKPHVKGFGWFGNWMAS